MSDEKKEVVWQTHEEAKRFHDWAQTQNPEMTYDDWDRAMDLRAYERVVENQKNHGKGGEK